MSTPGVFVMGQTGLWSSPEMGIRSKLSHSGLKSSRAQHSTERETRGRKGSHYHNKEKDVLNLLNPVTCGVGIRSK
ncbi:hypothetical protein PoB_002561300 [Plakobranchus ocellatus]|uniref:Uncharacterized protein n=1 Tax=Plakobranchus ocellatus TaxID=259542 RepID=A0AAV3ZW89_9GAST|nr:hypothetical protein PoB_002561300 [Plakobranchus ocellatus]